MGQGVRSKASSLKRGCGLSLAGLLLAGAWSAALARPAPDPAPDPAPGYQTRLDALVAGMACGDPSDTADPVTFGVRSGRNMDRVGRAVDSLGAKLSYFHRLPGDARPGVIDGYQMDFCREWLPETEATQPLRLAQAGGDTTLGGTAGVTEGLVESLPAPRRSISEIARLAPAVTINGGAPPGTYMGTFGLDPEILGQGDGATLFDWTPRDALGPNIVRVGESGQFTFQGSSPCGDIVAAHGWNQISIPCESPAPGRGAPAAPGMAQGGGAGVAQGGDTAGAGQELTEGEKQYPGMGDLWVQAFAGTFGGATVPTVPTGRGDHISDASLTAVTHGQETVEGEVRDKLDTFTDNSSVAINDFLRASYDYRQTYALIQSASTGLQREVAVWEAGKPGMEQADFYIAIVQIVGGISKLGVKVAHWYQLRKAVPKTPPAGTGQAVARAESQAATAASETGTMIGGTGASGRPATQVVGQSGTQVTTAAGRTPTQLVGQSGTQVTTAAGRTPTQLVGQSGTQVTTAAGRTPTQLVGQSGTQVSGVGRVPRGGGGGPASSGAATRGSSAAGGGGLPGPAPQMIQRAVDVERWVGPQLAKAAQEAGVDAEAIIRGSGGFAQTALNRVMNAIAAARGWHDLPIGLESAAQSILATVRRANAGDEIAIAALQSDGMAFQLRILRNFAQNQPDFYKWLRSAASGFDDFHWDIDLLFNDDAIKLLKLITENGFDLKAIRAVLGPMDDAGRLALGWGGPSLGTILGLSGASLSAGNYLTQDGSAPGGAAPQFGAGSSERDALVAQAAAIYSSQNVALGDVRQAMGGIWSRLDQGQGFAHIIGGEMWNWFMSPTTTYFNWWQDVGLSGEYLDLVTNYGQEFTDLTAHLTASIQSLRALQNAFNEAGITADSAALGGGSIAQLQTLLLEIDNTFATATPEWRAAHSGEYFAQRTQILQDITSLEEMNAGFRNFLARLPNLIQWLDQLRMNSAAGGMRTAVQVFNPDIYVRIASVGLYLKILASQGLLLDASDPLTVKPYDDQKWLSMSPDELKQAVLALPPGGTLDYPVRTWPRFSPEQRAAIQEAGAQRQAANVDRMDSGVEQAPGDGQSYDDFLDSLLPRGSGQSPPVNEYRGAFNPTEPVTFGVQSGANLDRAVNTVNSLGGKITYTFRSPVDLRLDLEYDLQVSAQPPSDPAAEQAFRTGMENLQRFDVIGYYETDYCREWLPQPGAMPDWADESGSVGIGGDSLPPAGN